MQLISRILSLTCCKKCISISFRSFSVLLVFVRCSSMSIFFFFLKGCGEGVDNGVVMDVGADVDGVEVSTKSRISAVKDCSLKLFSLDSDDKSSNK